jgi:hypothetical protein
MAKIKIESPYLKANINVYKGNIVKLIDEGKQKPMTGLDGKEKMVWEFTVELSTGETKIYTMNTSTQKVLIDAWGDDTKDWINKPLEVSIDRKVIAGQLKNVLYLIPAEGIKTKDIPVIEDEDETVPMPEEE